MAYKEDLKNPVDMYYSGEYEKQEQPYPGIQSDMKPVPDSGEKSYVGHGRLQGRKALITGGDSGIGRAVAIAFAREGADILVNYLPDEQKDADSLKELLEQEGHTVYLYPGNLGDEEFCGELVREAVDKLGGLDLMALVAGRQHAVENLEDLSTQQLRETFEVNVFSLYWIMKEALKYLPEGSSVITTTSIQDYQPSPNLLDYAATKSAITAFTRALAKQLAKKGIRVNSVAPGPIWTPLQISGGQPQSHIPEFGHNTPLGRAGEPAELAGVYVFLASNESSYVTAEVYGVTGGNHTE
ncbi:MAG: SDR family oxidoreductase [Alistipes sp.]|nr:SDR family oxidoreductase [Alistipes sp.]